MNNAERDAMLKTINNTLDGVHESVVRMEEHAHNPMSCPVMAEHKGDHDKPLDNHKEAHGRHIRWVVWAVGVVSIIVGGLVALIKLVE